MVLADAPPTNDPTKAKELRPAKHGRRLTMLQRVLVRAPDSNVIALSGAVAGLTAGLAVCPLDVVKTRLQAQGGLQAALAPGSVGARRYKGIVGTVSTIFREEGIRGLYRGVVPICVGYLPTWTIYFALYERSKKVFAQYSIGQESPFLCHVLSALSAGTVSTLVTNPIWVVKTRIMSQNKNSFWSYHGTWDAFKTMYKQEGLSVFYSGIGPALLGLTHVAVQFPLYERCKAYFVADESDPSMSGVLISSVLSKIAASSITYPHEVIRTRNQIQRNTDSRPKYSGIIPTARIIFKEEGFAAFYAGMGTNMFRSIPSSAVTLMTFEYVSQHLLATKASLAHEPLA